jgi:hypothetical protein
LTGATAPAKNDGVRIWQLVGLAVLPDHLVIRVSQEWPTDLGTRAEAEAVVKNRLQRRKLDCRNWIRYDSP